MTPAASPVQGFWCTVRPDGFGVCAQGDRGAGACEARRARATDGTRLRKAAEADRRTMGDFAIIAIERAVEEFEATIAVKKAEKPTR